MSRALCIRSTVIAVWAFCASTAGCLTAFAQQPLGAPPWKEDFEGPNISWQDAGGDTQYTIAAHARVRGFAHSGQQSEMLRIDCQQGSLVYISHDIGRPAAIEDLRPSVWVASDRPGLQFFAEIIFPRTLDPQTGKPVFTQIYGTPYTDPGHWQQLRIDNIAAQLPGKLRVLRNQLNANVDGGQAYVSRVLLNVYGGAGQTNVWIDELQVLGHVPAQGLPANGMVAMPIQSRYGTQREEGSGQKAVGSNESLPNGYSRQPTSVGREVKLNGSVLTVNGYPMFPRAVEYCGEHLEVLKKIGFNTVWCRDVPPLALRQEARSLGLWIICPPPQSLIQQVERDGMPMISPPEPIGDDFDQVLVWNLGMGLTGEQVEDNHRWAEQVSLADARHPRPLICSPVNNLRAYSRNVNMLLIDRRPLGTSMQMPDYGTWVRRQPLLARPGTPVWTTIQTQPSDGLRRQLATLGGGAPPPNSIAPDQLRLLVYTAVSSGSRGLLFLSDKSLEATDPETQQRAASLQLLNLELETIEPWAAGGQITGTIESNQPLVSGTILQSDRARIVLPIWLAPGSQCVAPLAAASPSKPLMVTLPGVPESSRVFEIAAGRLEPLRVKRAAGGTSVTLDDFGLTAMLFLAQDPTIIEAVTRRVSAHGQQIAALERYLAARKLQTVEQTLPLIQRYIPARYDPAPDLKTARDNMTLCDARLAAGDFAQASIDARQAMKAMRFIERVAWEAAMGDGSRQRAAESRQKAEPNGPSLPAAYSLLPIHSPVESPGTCMFSTLPWHWALAERMGTLRGGGNRLFGGDFENFDLMVRTGWRHYEHPTPGIQAAADLVGDAAHSGNYGLRLTARAIDPERSPTMIESPPVWITSPAVMVEAGQTVRIHGWINIPLAISGSVDGLMVIDSLTGEDMADRIDKTAGWQEFNVLRVVPQSGPMSVTFAMTGLGEVRLDDVSIETLEPAFGPAR